MKTSIIKYSMVLACLLLSTYSKAQFIDPGEPGGFTHDYYEISCPPVTVNFTNIETAEDGDFFVWWFGSDGPYTVIDSSYTFTQGGYYGIRMVQFNVTGTPIGVWEQYIYISGVSLMISSDTACPGDEIFFELQAYEDVNDDEIFWDFGDGNSAYGWEVYHVYESIGTYEVTLITDV